MDQFFNRVHQQVKGVMYEVEAAVVGLAQPSTNKQKRATTTVRQPFILQTPTGCDTERWGLEDAMIGVWHYGEHASYQIFSSDGKLMFREGKRKGELVPSADRDWWIGRLTNPKGDAIGSIKLRKEVGVDKMISHFRSAKGTVWGKAITATKESQEDALHSRLPLLAPSTKTPRCQSRPMPEEAEKDKGKETARRKHAKTAPPQELHFVAPEDCVAGNPVCLLGPHGDPITVPLPEGAQPGKPCKVFLGPKSSYQVIVPEGALPGTTVIFNTEDGETLNTVVPPGKNPGETMEIVPPVVLIQVPPGASSGEELIYTTPIGTLAVVQVPAGFGPGHYFATLLPVPPNLAEIAMRDQAKGAEQRHALEQVPTVTRHLAQQEKQSVEKPDLPRITETEEDPSALFDPDDIGASTPQEPAKWPDSPPHTTPLMRASRSISGSSGDEVTSEKVSKPEAATAEAPPPPPIEPAFHDHHPDDDVVPSLAPRNSSSCLPSRIETVTTIVDCDTGLKEEMEIVKVTV